MVSEQNIALARQVLDLCRSKHLRIVTAESCTGGLIAATLTEIAGSSDVVWGGFVTYSNEAKVKLLGVPDPLLREHGAVSEQVARVMAEGALQNSTADVSIAVTGIAGPSGATETKPVGLVHLAASRHGGETIHAQCHFSGAREDVRTQAVAKALEMIFDLAS